MDLLLVDSVYLSWDFLESLDVGGGMIKMVPHVRPLSCNMIKMLDLGVDSPPQT